jgi:hypothetical protein
MLSLGRFFRGDDAVHPVCSHVDQVLRRTSPIILQRTLSTATSSALHLCFLPKARAPFGAGQETPPAAFPC